MKIKKEEFLKILSFVKPAVHKEEYGGMDGLLFTGETVSTYNQEISINYSFKSDFSCLVSATKLLGVLESAPDEDIVLEMKDKQLRLKSGNLESGIATLEKGPLENSLDTLGLENVKKWNKLPEDFVKGLNLCLFSVSRDVSLGVLTSVYVGKKEIISSDNLRISVYKTASPLSVEEGGMLIPRTVLVELIKHELKGFFITDSWVHFLVEDKATFSFRRLNLEYPSNVEKFFDFKGISLTLPIDGLKEALDSLLVFAEGDISELMGYFDIEVGKILCKSESPKGWIKRTIKADLKYKGKPFSFRINPVFLGHILGKSPKMVLDDEKTKALFQSENFNHVMALPTE